MRSNRVVDNHKVARMPRKDAALLVDEVDEGTHDVVVKQGAVREDNASALLVALVDPARVGGDDLGEGARALMLAMLACITCFNVSHACIHYASRRA